MTEFNLWLAAPSPVAAIVVLILAPIRLRHATVRLFVSVLTAALMVVPIVDAFHLLPVEIRIANPVLSISDLRVPFLLEPTVVASVLQGFLAGALALTVLQLSSTSRLDTVIGLAVQVLGSGLALMAGDLVLAVLMWQVVDLGRWLSRRHVPIWELLGSLAVVSGSLQLALASGGSAWTDLRQWALNPVWSTFLTLGLGLRLGLFPALPTLGTNGDDSVWPGFADVSATAIAVGVAFQLNQAGVIELSLLGPWGLVTLLVSLAASLPSSAVAQRARALLLTVMGCGLALTLSLGVGGGPLLALALAAAVYVLSTGVKWPSLWPMGLSLVSFIFAWAFASSGHGGSVPLLASLLMVAAGIVGGTSWAMSVGGLSGLGAVSLVGSLLMAGLFPAASAALGDLLPSLVALGAGLGLALTGLAVAGVVCLLTRVQIGVTSGLQVDGQDLLGNPQRLEGMASIADGLVIERAIHAFLERLSGAMERGFGSLGEQLALAWTVLMGVLIFMVVLR